MFNISKNKNEPTITRWDILKKKKMRIFFSAVKSLIKFRCFFSLWLAKWLKNDWQNDYQKAPKVLNSISAANYRTAEIFFVIFRKCSILFDCKKIENIVCLFTTENQKMWKKISENWVLIKSNFHLRKKHDFCIYMFKFQVNRQIISICFFKYQVWLMCYKNSVQALNRTKKWWFYDKKY